MARFAADKSNDEHEGRTADNSSAFNDLYWPKWQAPECFSSAILRLVGVGLPIDFMQFRQVEMTSPFANVL